MSASLMSCVRQNTPPLELEHSATSVEPASAGNVHQSHHQLHHSSSSAGPMPSLHTAEDYQHHRQQHLSQPPVDADAASLHSNTPKRRRRFQPLRKLRRIFRLNGAASSDDAASSMGASSSVYKPAASEPDFHTDANCSPIDMPIRVISPTGYGPPRAHRESRSHNKLSGSSKPVLHLRHDSRESLHHRDADYAQRQHQQQQHHRHHHGSGQRYENISAADAVDFQAGGHSASKHRSTSECLGVDMMSEALSQSHDSVFSESVTASSISIGLKAELSSVLAKKYAGRRSTSSEKRNDVRRRNDDDEDDDDEDDEDLGLPRSPNTPMRGTRSLAVSSSRASTAASTSVAMHASSDGSLSMLSMDSSDTNQAKAHRSHLRYQSESDTEVSVGPTTVSVLNHSAARHKMAVRPKRKQAPSRLSLGSSRTADETDAERMMPVLLEIDDEQQQRSVGGKSKSSSLPPGMNAKQLPTHAANRTVIAVNETSLAPTDMYANRSLSKSHDFDAKAAADVQKSTASGESKEPNGFFRRLLTYGSLKKKQSPTLPAVTVSRTQITESTDSLQSYAPASKYPAIVPPPEIAPKPSVKADKPRSGPAARQRVQPREFIVQSQVLSKQHSVEKLPPISPLTKKPTAHDRGSSEHVYQPKHRGSNEKVNQQTAKKSLSPSEYVPPVHGADVPRRRDSSSSNASKPRLSAELPARTFAMDSNSSTPTINGVRSFPQYRSDDQLFPRAKQNGTAASSALSGSGPFGVALPSARFSSTNCIVRNSGAIPPSSLNFAPMSNHQASSGGHSSGHHSQLSSPSTSQTSTPSASKQSPSRRLVEKSKSFRFYTDNSADSSMHSSAGQMPSLPDLSCWSSDNTSSADSPRSRSKGPGAPKNHRDLINKFEINDNNLVVQHRTPSKSSASDLIGATRESPRNTVYVTNVDTPAVKPASEAAALPATIVPVAIAKAAVETPTNITQIEDNIDRIMKFACVTVLKSPQPLASVDSSASSPSEESSAAVDRMALLERRQSVHEERMRFERRIQSEAAESPTSDSNADSTNGCAVVLRKKSVSYNNSRASQQPTPSIATKSDGDDQTPELMKVFARRSLKLKDTLYVTDEPMSITPASSPQSADEANSLAETLNAINNNNQVKPAATTTTNLIDKPSKTVGMATNVATALASAWLSNSSTTTVTSAVPVVSTKIPHVVHPKPKLANVFNNNILNSINNNRMEKADEPQTPNIHKANGNVEESNGIIGSSEVQLRHSSTGAKVSQSVGDEFKGILQRRAEWEKRATQQFK